ncbi:MAG: hypothetical protein HZA89_13575 [Verrucomicrobia bacterium]|nr:hypothetical protein [Verrucomicrobiota bacterium]
MIRWFTLGLAALLGAANVFAAEKQFDFSTPTTNGLPTGFRSTVTGVGHPGEWKIVMDEVPPALAPLTPAAPAPVKRPVLAQVARDRTDEHFPLLVQDAESYGDFKFTTRFKLVDGAEEQMAGVAFRIQDEKNYYVVRASGLGNNFRFYKFVDGVRSDPIGPEVRIARGVWHELSVECKGNQIRCLLNGEEAIPKLTDNSFSAGKIGFWTKSDSLTYFTDARITYTPRELLAQVVLRDAAAKYSRLVDLKLFASLNGEPLKAIASKEPNGLGEPGGSAEQDVYLRGVTYFGRTKTTISVTMPLRDRNGDVLAAARVTMTPFPGQTEQNAIVRAMPIVKHMEERLGSSRSLVE